MADRVFKDFDSQPSPAASDVFALQQNADDVYKKITFSALAAAIAAGGADVAPTDQNKDITAAVTTADGDAAGAALAQNPVGFVSVMVNGVLYNLGSGVKTKDCYFSDDAGLTAKAFADLITGDTLHWNGSVAGFQLAASDRIDLLYNAAI